MISWSMMSVIIIIMEISCIFNNFLGYLLQISNGYINLLATYKVHIVGLLPLNFIYEIKLELALIENIVLDDL